VTQTELNMEVARATGESVETISGMGFSVVTMPPPWVVDHRPRRCGFGRRLMHRDTKARRKPRKLRSRTTPVRIPTLASAA